MDPGEVLRNEAAAASLDDDPSLTFLVLMAEAGLRPSLTIVLSGGFVVRGDVVGARQWAEHVDGRVADSFAAALEHEVGGWTAEEWARVRDATATRFGQVNWVEHQAEKRRQLWEQVPDSLVNEQRGVDASRLPDELATEVIRDLAPEPALTLGNASLAHGNGDPTEVGMIRISRRAISAWWVGR